MADTMYVYLLRRFKWLDVSKPPCILLSLHLTHLHTVSALCLSSVDVRCVIHLGRCINALSFHFFAADGVTADDAAAARDVLARACCKRCYAVELRDI
jgi:hypothetical protein